MMTYDGKPTLIAMLIALVIVMGASTVSAMSGVGRGIKWLSNINMGLSLFCSPSSQFLNALFVLKAFLLVSGTTYWRSSCRFRFGPMTAQQLATPWPAGLGGWTIFMGVVDRLRTICRLVSRPHSGPQPERICAWGHDRAGNDIALCGSPFVGGTAIHLELYGDAERQILGTGISSRLFETINVMLSPILATAMSVIIVILLLTAPYIIGQTQRC